MASAGPYTGEGAGVRWSRPSVRAVAGAAREVTVVLTAAEVTMRPVVACAMLSVAASVATLGREVKTPRGTWQWESPAWRSG